VRRGSPSCATNQTAGPSCAVSADNVGFVKARVFVAVGVFAFVVAVVLGMNHVESCKLQCVTEGPSWAVVGSTFALSAAAFLAAVIVWAMRRQIGFVAPDRPEVGESEAGLARDPVD
jgi:hypothetical protein